jgi:hypothetical protein
MDSRTLSSSNSSQPRDRKPDVDRELSPDVVLSSSRETARILLLEQEEESTPLFPAPKAPRSGRWLWLTVLASLGLHAALMVIPTGEASKQTPPKPAEQVRITQLPSQKVPVPKSLSKPSVSLPQVVNRPRSTVPPISALREVPPLATEVKPQPTSTPTKDTPPATKPGENSWQDFPTYPAAQPGCFGLASCFQTGDTLTQVSAFFAKELPAKKYTLNRMVQEPGREVYQISRNGMTQFLSAIVDGKNTVYVLSDKPRTLDDLKKAVEIPPDIQAILNGLDAQQATSAYFANPSAFYTGQAPRSGIRNISLIGTQADTMMDEFLGTNLRNAEYDPPEQVEDYGGGRVYQVKKGSTVLYLNVVPTKDGSGTVLVVWEKQPT